MFSSLSPAVTLPPLHGRISMPGTLNDKRVAILATDGFEEVELLEPRRALQEAGATAVLISPHSGQIKAWAKTDWGAPIPVDKTVGEANPADYDALLLPGGVMNPDTLRTDESAVRFVRSFFEAQKPVAAICHGPWMLVEAGVVQGRKLTSWPSLKTDIKNAGGEWQDQEVVTDNGLVTSRKPDDIPAFNRKFIEEIGEGKHKEQRA